MRTKKQLLEAWECATKAKPLVLDEREMALFGEALREQSRKAKQANFNILDREKVIGDGVKSMLDDTVYRSRHAYETHLKENGCRVVGNDVRNPKRLEQPHGQNRTH